MKIQVMWSLIWLLLGSTAFGGAFQDAGEYKSSPQGISVVVKGKITSDSTGDPIVHHAVIITIEGLGYSSTKYTNLDGYYTDTIHDVGTGYYVLVATLDCHQVLHSQSFLIISTLVVINFEICDNPPLECHAIFFHQLDSLNKEPNTFNFFNISTGNANHWYWQFGDGSVSIEENPVHRYLSPGNYDVCLVITREEAGIVVCRDSICHTLNTAIYHDIGGHLFAGESPINNPIHEGDTGIAFLYRVSHGLVIPLDTSVFTYLGYYSFPQILQGEYLIRAELAQGSVNYNNFFSGYVKQEIKWTEADLITLTDSNYFKGNIYMQPCAEGKTGPAAIRGYITEGEQTGSTLFVPNAEVILFDSQLVPLCFDKSDDSGRFTFSNLPYGNYALYVDYPGKYSRVIGVSISSPATVTDSVHLELFDHNVTAINDLTVTNYFTSLLYPNPVKEEVRMLVTIARPERLIFNIVNPAGKSVFKMERGVGTGESLITIPARGLESGLYFLIVRSADGLLINTRKFIKN